MKKQIRMVLTLIAFSTAVNIALADGSAFTPLNFDDSTSVAPVAPKSVPAEVKPASNPISSAFSKLMPEKNVQSIDTASGEIPVGNDNIQNAILELDNAQVGIRDDLLNYKAKFADVDAQYKLIKNERTMLSRQVRSTERRIRNIDRAKDRIRKNML